MGGKEVGIERKNVVSDSSLRKNKHTGRSN
jgi:hypothetical protein